MKKNALERIDNIAPLNTHELTLTEQEQLYVNDVLSGRPMIRTQMESAAIREAISKGTGTTFDPNEDRTRQEFTKEADVNFVLERHGIDALGNVRELQYGERDYTVDLQGAITAQKAVVGAWDELPEEIKLKYGHINNLLAAAESGQLQLDAQEALENARMAQEARSGAVPPNPPSGDPEPAKQRRRSESSGDDKTS